MTRRHLALFAAALSLPVLAFAQDEEDLPDLDFLEYLGSWEDGDEDWVVVAEEFMGQPAAAADTPGPAGEEESDDADENENEDEDEDEDATGDDDAD